MVHLKWTMAIEIVEIIVRKLPIECNLEQYCHLFIIYKELDLTPLVLVLLVPGKLPDMFHLRPAGFGKLQFENLCDIKNFNSRL